MAKTKQADARSRAPSSKPARKTPAAAAKLRNAAALALRSCIEEQYLLNCVPEHEVDTPSANATTVELATNIADVLRSAGLLAPFSMLVESGVFAPSACPGLRKSCLRYAAADMFGRPCNKNEKAELRADVSRKLLAALEAVPREWRLALNMMSTGTEPCDSDGEI